MEKKPTKDPSVELAKNEFAKIVFEDFGAKDTVKHLLDGIDTFVMSITQTYGIQDSEASFISVVNRIALAVAKSQLSDKTIQITEHENK